MRDLARYRQGTANGRVWYLGEEVAVELDDLAAERLVEAEVRVLFRVQGLGQVVERARLALRIGQDRIR
eukprot:3940457-Rhodomonas_salina.4